MSTPSTKPEIFKALNVTPSRVFATNVFLPVTFWGASLSMTACPPNLRPFNRPSKLKQRYRTYTERSGLPGRHKRPRRYPYLNPLDNVMFWNCLFPGILKLPSVSIPWLIQWSTSTSCIFKSPVTSKLPTSRFFIIFIPVTIFFLSYLITSFVKSRLFVR